MMQSAQEAEVARQQAAQYQEEQRTIQQQAVALQAQQLQFQQEQAEYVRQTEEKMRELANRPPPPPAAPTATVATGEGGTVADTIQDAVNSRKKGRAALRIDLNAPQTAGATGLNIPRG